MYIFPLLLFLALVIRICPHLPKQTKFSRLGSSLKSKTADKLDILLIIPQQKLVVLINRKAPDHFNRNLLI